MADQFPAPSEDDGLPCSPVRGWAEDKYRLVHLYDSLFSTGIKKSWQSRVYIDLFSGPGVASVQGSSRLLWGSPMLALSVRDRFDKYIFCEKDSSSLDALKNRVEAHFPEADVSYVLGDCNDKVEDICRFIPKASKSYKVLSFCFIDPYNLGVKFSTVRRIASYFVDFMLLLALHMDANRNETIYTNPENKTLDEFLGQSDWRTRWAHQTMPKDFPRFLAEEYAAQMETLGYLPVPFYRMKQVRSDVKNLPLYHLALFSRHRLADEYWDQVLKYSSAQRALWD